MSSQPSTLPALTAAVIRHALEEIQMCVQTEAFYGESTRRPLLELALGVGYVYDRKLPDGTRPLANALVRGLSAIAGPEWRMLTGQPALDAVSAAMREASKL